MKLTKVVNAIATKRVTIDPEYNEKIPFKIDDNTSVKDGAILLIKPLPCAFNSTIRVIQEVISELEIDIHNEGKNSDFSDVLINANGTIDYFINDDGTMTDTALAKESNYWDEMVGFACINEGDVIAEVEVYE